MTQESLEQANRIKHALEEITEAKHDIMTYHNERLELEVIVKKGLMNYHAEEKRRFTLWSDSPLFVAIAAAIEGMREELVEQLENLDSNMKKKSVLEQSYEDYHPIAKTSWWKKAFSWCHAK